MNRVRKSQFFFWFGFLSPSILNASFIEATMGTAVVNDATAAYHNPAALTLLTKGQLIGLGSIAHSRAIFQGQVSQASSRFIQQGTAATQSNFYLPSFYLALPTTATIVTGLAIISNFFNNDVDQQSLLRYAQSGNNVQSIDFVPALGYRVNTSIALGASLNFSMADFELNPIFGIPSLNIPDSQSHNQARANSMGGDFGFLIRPAKKILIGFNHRSKNTYLFRGKSVLETIPRVVSNRYQFKFWTPARSVLTLSYTVNPKIGLFGTINRIFWGVFKVGEIQNIAIQRRQAPAILERATIDYHYRDTWLLTLGGQYHLSDKTVIRSALSFNEAPGNPFYQIVHGDSLILGGSFGYKLTKNLSFDAGYSHAFYRKENIGTHGVFVIQGINSVSRNAVSLKLIWRAT